MWISIWFFWYRVQPYLPKLYVIGLISACVYADTYLSNFVQVLQNNLVFSAFAASATINLNDAVSGIFSVIGAVLRDEYLTDHGLIFLSSLIYFMGLTIIAAENQRSNYALSAFGSGSLTIIFPLHANAAIILVGLFVSGIGKLSVMNSSIELSEENGGTNERNSKSLTKFIGYLLGDDTAIFRYVQSHGYIILLVFTKYATKTVFILVSSIVGSKYGESVQYNIMVHKKSIFVRLVLAGTWLPASGLGIVTLITLVHIKSFKKPMEDRQQTPLKHFSRVCIVAIKKRHMLCPPDPPAELLYEGNTDYRLKHTIGFRFLDKAAIIQSAVPDDERKQGSLCTVTEVEESKLLFRMLPMCITFLGYGVVKSMGNTIFLLQGTNMLISEFGNIEVPIQGLIVMGEISGSITRGLYGLLLSKRLNGSGRIYGPPIRYAIGMVLATFCCTVASWIATDKLDFISYLRREHRMPEYEEYLALVDSMLWLIPQFLLFGAMSEITRDGIKGFFHHQLPPSMVTYDTAFTDAITGAGAIFSILISYALGFASIHNDPFLSAKLYSNKELAKYYRVMTVLSFIFLSVYAFVATRYRYKHSNGTPPN